MPHIRISTGAPVWTALAIALAGLVLASCGGSSNTSSTATASAAASPPGAGASGGGRFAALRECLAKNGITLPRRTPGQGRGGVLPGGAGAARRLPAGVTRAQFEAAVKKCGGLPRGGSLGGARRLNNPAFTAALAKFAACMRSGGVKLPEPNTSGKGPVFNTTGVDTNSPQFRSARAKCQSALRGVLPGAGGPPAAGAPGGAG
jgi:hypothetical protein